MEATSMLSVHFNSLAEVESVRPSSFTGSRGQSINHLHLNDTTGLFFADVEIIEAFKAKLDDLILRVREAEATAAASERV